VRGRLVALLAASLIVVDRSNEAFIHGFRTGWSLSRPATSSR
jgi:hypothetical protein